MTHEQETAKYIRENFEPGDRIALVVLSRQDGSGLQRITSAENAASPKYQAWLRAENAKGRDIYISMNALAAHAQGRTKEDVACIRHIYLDLDSGGKPALDRMLGDKDLPEPNHVLDTSPGKYQIIWRVEGFSKEGAEELQRGLVARYGGDPAATDCSRVLRLPGFTNRKPEYVTREEGNPDRYPWVTVHNRSHEVYRPDRFPAIERGERVVGPTTRCATVAPGTPRAHGADVSQSSHDFRYAMLALREGVAEETVKAAIIRDRSADRKHPNVRDYANRTVRKAAAFISRSAGTPDR